MSEKESIEARYDAYMLAPKEVQMTMLDNDPELWFVVNKIDSEIQRILNKCYVLLNLSERAKDSVVCVYVSKSGKALTDEEILDAEEKFMTEDKFDKELIQSFLDNDAYVEEVKLVGI